MGTITLSDAWGAKTPQIVADASCAEAKAAAARAYGGTDWVPSVCSSDPVQVGGFVQFTYQYGGTTNWSITALTGVATDTPTSTSPVFSMTTAEAAQIAWSMGLVLSVGWTVRMLIRVMNSADHGDRHD